MPPFASASVTSSPAGSLTSLDIMRRSTRRTALGGTLDYSRQVVAIRTVPGTRRRILISTPNAIAPTGGLKNFSSWSRVVMRRTREISARSRPVICLGSLAEIIRAGDYVRLREFFHDLLLSSRTFVVTRRGVVVSLFLRPQTRVEIFMERAWDF